MKTALFLAFYFVVNNLFSQSFYVERKDTSFIKNGYKISITYNRPPLDNSKIWETSIDEYTNPILSNPDSIHSLLKDHLIYKTYEWDENSTPYLAGLICNNGFKVLFEHSVTPLHYYPVEKVISMEGYSSPVSHTFQLTDGQITYPPDKIYFSKDKMFRWGELRQDTYDNFSNYWILEIYNKNRKEYVRVLNLADILPYSFHITDIRWIDNVFYFYDDNEDTWAVRVQPIDNITKEHSA